MKKLRIAALALLAVFLIAQVVPAERTNPPVTKDVGAPPEVDAILRASCYDCHSNETVWPWYAAVAPAKFLVVDHVRVGRSHLNFSEWDGYSAEERRHKLTECMEEVATDHMPEGGYLWLHSDAALDDAKKAVLKAWFEAEKAK